jgi:3',5'-cyclic AMP phosphodiesterase CpdA
VTLLAHISDLHVDATPRSHDRVRRVVAHLCSLPIQPDALLVTGDIADRGDPDAYRAAAELLHVPFPVLACPGNHDSRGPLRAALLGGPDSPAPVNSAHRVDDVTVLMCDSSIPGRADGRLEESTLAWIEQELSAGADRGPALLALHHPPVPVRHPIPDGESLADVGELAALLERHPRVIAVLAGHAHTAAASVLAGRPVLLAPGVASTMFIPAQPGIPVDLDAPVGYALHFVEDGQITTHFRTVPEER